MSINLTKEQKDKINTYVHDGEGQRNRALAWKYFEMNGEIPKDHKPYEYCMHHEDENLKWTDPWRYKQWYGYDLVIELYSEHSKHHNKGKEVTDETRHKLSEVKKGKPSWNKGKKASENTRKKMSKALKGKHAWNKGKTEVYSEETLQKMRKPKSEEHKQHIKENHSDVSGENNPMYGKKGKENPNYGKHAYNNGIIGIRAYECPEGFVPGKLKKSKVSHSYVEEKL